MLGTSDWPRRKSKKSIVCQDMKSNKIYIKWKDHTEVISFMLEIIPIYFLYYIHYKYLKRQEDGFLYRYVFCRKTPPLH